MDVFDVSVQGLLVVRFAGQLELPGDQVLLMIRILQLNRVVLRFNFAEAYLV